MSAKQYIFSKFVVLWVVQITKLKIDSNPFAKGFRDTARLGEIERYESVNNQISQFYFVC